MGRTRTLDASQARPTRFEPLGIDLMNRLLDPGPGGAAKALLDVLERLGQAYGLDRTFLRHYGPDGQIAECHEWARPGVLAFSDRHRAAEPLGVAAWQSALQAGQPVEIRNRDDLVEDVPQRRFLEQIGVHCTLMLPLRDGDRLVGILGCESENPGHDCADDEVLLLASVGRAVTSVLLRAEAHATELALRSHLEATLRALPDLVIEVGPSGTLMACHSDKLPWVSELVRAGLGRHFQEVLPEPLAVALAEILAEPPLGDDIRTRRVSIASLAAPQWYDLSVAPLRPTEVAGRAGALVVVRDLAAAAASNEVASYREGQFTAFFEMCPHPILLNDYDTGELLDGNHAFKNVFGIDPQNPPGRNVRDILPEEDAWLIDLAIEALNARQSYGPVEIQLRRSDGRRFPAVIRGFMSIDPNGRRLVWALAEDVTDIRAKEVALLAEQRALEATRTRLVSAIEALDDGFAIFDADDRLVLWNTPYTRVFAGIADLIVPGALYDDLLRAAIDRGIFGSEDERDNQALQRRLDRALIDVWDGEDEFADGRLIWVRERATPERETVGLYEDVTARRLADRRLQQVVDSGEVAVWDWDDDRGLSVMNDRWRTVLGFEGAGTSLPDLLRLLHHEDVPAVLQAQSKLFKQGAEDFDLLCRLRHSSGRWVWLLSRGRVLARRGDGKPRRISGVTLDVSARVEAEQRLTRLIDGARLGTWEHDFRQGFTIVNEQWAEIIGHRAAELNPLPLSSWLAMIHPADAEALLDSEARAFDTGQWIIEHEMRLLHRDGHWVWVLSRGQVIEWDSAGHPVRISGVHLDVSAAKALETALARERDTLARIMETSVSGVVVVDGVGRVVFANAAAEAVLGRPIAAKDDLLAILADADVTDLHGAPLKPEELPVNRALAGLAVQKDVRQAIRWPDGTRRVLSVNAARLSASGAELAVVSSLTDITDAVDGEDRLRAAMTSAETASRAKSDFLAAMSHEMRTPLNGVLGMAELLDRQMSDPDQRAMLNTIRESGEHLLAVINDILDLAKIEAGHLMLDLAPLRLGDVVSRVLAIHQVKADEKGIDLIVEWRDMRPPHMRLGDEKRLVQILHNLIGNAIKFTHQGKVVLRLDTGSDQRLLIEIIDTGIGMSADDMTRVFDDFIQGQGGIARSYGGTGLGLAIVRRLARLMHGDVALSGALGEGLVATVDIEMPVVIVASSETTSAPPLQLPALRVLAAEDNGTNRIILDGMLRSLGVKAEIFPSGEAAIRRWQEAEFDVVLLDIAMPGQDGVATLAVMQAHARATSRALPWALAVTANAMTHQVADYISQGFVGVVPKPLREDELAKSLSLCLAAIRPE